MNKRPTKATLIRFFTNKLRLHGERVPAEIRLWRGVLLQLIIDAVGYSGHNGGDKYQAWDLLTKGRADFKELCDMAEVDAEFVRDNVRKVCYG